MRTSVRRVRRLGSHPCEARTPGNLRLSGPRGRRLVRTANPESCPGAGELAVQEVPLYSVVAVGPTASPIESGGWLWVQRWRVVDRGPDLVKALLLGPDDGRFPAMLAPRHTIVSSTGDPATHPLACLAKSRLLASPCWFCPLGSILEAGRPSWSSWSLSIITIGAQQRCFDLDRVQDENAILRYRPLALSSNSDCKATGHRPREHESNGRSYDSRLVVIRRRHHERQQQTTRRRGGWL